MYNDDDEEMYDEEQEETIEDEIAQRRQINELNKMNARPSTKIGNGIKNKASGAVKGAVKGAAKGIARGAKVLLAKVTAFIIANPIILLALAIIIIIIIIYFAITNALSNSVTSGVDNYIKSEVDDMSDASKEAYEKNSSLLLLKVSEVNEIYEKYIIDNDTKGDIKSLMRTVMGTNPVQGEVTYQYKKQFTPKDVLNAAKKLTDRFAKEKYLYGDPRYVPAGSNGLTAGNETDSSGKVIGSVGKCMSSNGFVSWVLTEVGLTNQPKSGLEIGKDYNTENVGLAWFCEKNGFKKITSKGDLESGDIVFLKNSGSSIVSHVYIFDSWKSSDKTECKAYDCGSKEWIQGGHQPITRSFVTAGKEFMFAYRPERTTSGKHSGDLLKSAEALTKEGITYQSFRSWNGHDVSDYVCCDFIMEVLWRALGIDTWGRSEIRNVEGMYNYLKADQSIVYYTDDIKPIDLSILQPGDIIGWDFTGYDTKWDHVGIYAGDNYIFHNGRSNGVVRQGMDGWDESKTRIKYIGRIINKK